MKRLTVALFFTILCSGCSFVSPKKQNDLIVRVSQSPSGKISKEEFVDWNIKRIFKIYDRGGKGYVTLQDWQALQGTSKDTQFRCDAAPLKQKFKNSLFGFTHLRSRLLNGRAASI
jgi:hypothetical protein